MRASVVCIASVVGLKITRSPARVVVAFIVKEGEGLKVITIAHYKHTHYQMGLLSFFATCTFNTNSQCQHDF